MACGKFISRSSERADFEKNDYSARRSIHMGNSFSGRIAGDRGINRCENENAKDGEAEKISRACGACKKHDCLKRI